MSSSGLGPQFHSLLDEARIVGLSQTMPHPVILFGMYLDSHLILIVASNRYSGLHDSSDLLRSILKITREEKVQSSQNLKSVS